MHELAHAFAPSHEPFPSCTTPTQGLAPQTVARVHSRGARVTLSESTSAGGWRATRRVPTRRSRMRLQRSFRASRGELSLALSRWVSVVKTRSVGLKTHTM